MILLVLGTNRFKFSNDNGEVIQGTSVLAVDEPAYTETQKGFIVNKISLPHDSEIKLEQVPAYYECDIGMRPGPGGKPQATLKSAKYVKALQLDFTAATTK